MRSSTLETVSPYATGHVLGLSSNQYGSGMFVLLLVRYLYMVRFL